MHKILFPHPPSVPLALVIDLKAVAHNYRTLRSLTKEGTICAAVLKANAYGLGIKEVASCLYQEGCRHFFLAHLSEAIELQHVLKHDSFIYVLNGLRKGDEEVYAYYNLIPVLSDISQIQAWNTFSKNKQQCLKAAIHFDTGLMRTGLTPQDMKSLGLADFSHTEIVCVMSHLACTYQYSHPMNKAQQIAFDALRKHFPFALASLANSGRVFFGPEYHYDLTRVGLALTGCRSAIPQGTYCLKPAIKAYAQILQINEISRGQSVGYDATFIASRASRIATVGVGYADGYLRSLSNRGAIYFNGYTLPVVGRVSMDLITIDITEVPPDQVRIGDWIELFGDHIRIDALAEKAETISWELLTRLGSRFERFYLTAQKPNEVI
ncbi:MAG: alanine racemase [Alphaproteobacteria bacterium]|nr:alanine racemase [Alphaproteobacteria bacterium]